MYIGREGASCVNEPEIGFDKVAKLNTVVEFNS